MNTASRCYKIIDHLPALPEDLIQQCLDRAQLSYNNTMPEGADTIKPGLLNARTVSKSGQNFPSIRVPRFPINDIVEEWVSKNISDRWINIGLATSMPNPQSSIHAAHTDGSRRYNLLYLIDSFNPDQHTMFYQEPEQALVREPNTLIKNLDTLETIASVTIQPRTWTYLNVRVLHGVENIKGHRTALHIDFDQDPFGVFE